VDGCKVVIVCRLTARAHTPRKYQQVFGACCGEAREAELSPPALISSAPAGGKIMARKYSKKASSTVERAMKKRKAGTLKSGRSGRKVKSRKQAIAIGLSEARAAGAKVPKKTARKKTAKKAKRGSRR
jgi:hypothetical protein